MVQQIHELQNPTIHKSVVLPPLAPDYTPEEKDRLERAATVFGNPFEMEDKGRDWVAEEVTRTRILTADVLKDVARHHVKRAQAKTVQTIPEVPAQPKGEVLSLAENAVEQAFFEQPEQEAEKVAESLRVREEWTREENERMAAYEQKMRSRSWKEKLSSFGRDMWKSISALLPGAASRTINREFQAEGLEPSMPTFTEGVSKEMKSGWANFTSNFSIGGGLNRELDQQLENGELTTEEHAVLRKPTIRERLSSASQRLSSKLAAASGSGQSSSQNTVGGSGGSDSGNDNEGNGGDGPQKPPRKRWRLVAGVVAAAALFTGYAALKKDSDQRGSAPSASTTPNPSGTASSKAHSLTPAPTASQNDAVVGETPEEEGAQPPVMDKKEKVVARPTPAPRLVAPKKAKAVIVPKERPVEPKVTEKVEEKKPEPPKVAEKQPQPKEHLTPMHLYYKELKAQWARIQDMEQRMKFVYGRHVSAKPARSIVSVQHPKAAPYKPNTRYVKCKVECGTDDQKQIVDLLNGARALLSEGRFNKSDTLAAVADKVTKGRVNVVAAQAKINEAERLFADEEEAAKRTYVANRIAYADLHQSSAREKLAFLDRQLIAHGIPINGRIVLKIGPTQGSHSEKSGRSEYTVKMTTAPQVYDLHALREKLMQAETDMELHVSSFTPKKAQRTYKSLYDVNAALDQIIPMAQRGYVAPAPSKVSSKADKKATPSDTEVLFDAPIKLKPVRTKLIRPRAKQKQTKASTPKASQKRASFARRMFQSMKRYAAARTA